MSRWLNPIELSGKYIKLEPLTLDHTEGLTEAVRDGDLWQLWYTSTPKPEEVTRYIEVAIDEFNRDQSLPFAVISQQENKVIGTTRYMNADARHKRLEIGTTWYAKSVQRTGINTECKYLLLQHAFEHLSCIAVEFRTHWHNLKSRKAIERLGAKQDGVLRNHQIDELGCLRDTVVFSILDNEWKTVKQSLQFKMADTYSK